ncbi:hypothetical protein Bca4012_015307 [Brassica carinata]
MKPPNTTSSGISPLEMPKMLQQEPAKECDQSAGDHLFVSGIISKSDVSTAYIEVFPKFNHFQGLNHFVSLRKRLTFCRHVVTVSFPFG